MRPSTAASQTPTGAIVALLVALSGSACTIQHQVQGSPDVPIVATDATGEAPAMDARDSDAIVSNVDVPVRTDNTPDTGDAPDIVMPTDVPADVGDTGSDASDNVVPGDAYDANDGYDAFDATDAYDAYDATDAYDAFDAFDAYDAFDAHDAFDAGPPDTGNPAPNFHTVPTDRMDTAFNGSGGISSHTSECGDAEVMTGVVGNAGMYMNAIGVHCATLQPDGTLTNDRIIAAIGGTSGTDFDDPCPANELVSGNQGRSGAIIDAYGATCSRIGPWLASRMTSTVLAAHGGNGGSPWSAQCPAGYVGHGLDFDIGVLMLARRVSQVRLKCIRVAP